MIRASAHDIFVNRQSAQISGTRIGFNRSSNGEGINMTATTTAEEIGEARSEAAGS